MTVQPKLLCDQCQTQVLSAVGIVAAQAPERWSHICIPCLMRKMDRFREMGGSKDAESE